MTATVRWSLAKLTIIVIILEGQFQGKVVPLCNFVLFEVPAIRIPIHS